MIQLLGAVAIVSWTCIMSGSFFYISEYSGILKISERAEILGGDLHYFAPVKFQGELSDYFNEAELKLD